MKALYLILDICTLAFPLILSFDSKVRYFQNWKHVLLATLVVSVPYIAWDYIFTHEHVWGFNSDYLTGVHFGILPIEELLFFLVVPFACVFIYECCKFYLKETHPKWIDNAVQLILLLTIAFVIFNNPTGKYTLSVSVAALITVLIWRFGKNYRFIGTAFLISMIPFVFMNGTLTGFFTASPVVWYSLYEFSGYRLLSIPVEDILYSFSLITLTILLFERIKSRSSHD